MYIGMLARSVQSQYFPFHASNSTYGRWLEVNQLLTNSSELLKALGSVVDECTRIQKMPVNPLSLAMRADIMSVLTVQR